jgi:hypothetical protein
LFELKDLRAVTRLLEAEGLSASATHFGFAQISPSAFLTS